MNTKRILIFAALAASLASCSQDELSTTSVNKDLTPLGVSSASLATVVTRDADPTLTVGSLGLFLTNTTGGYTAASNVEYDKATDQSAWSSQTPIYLGTQQATIYAYYPYNSNPGITDVTNVPLKSQVYTAANDLAYAQAVSVTSATINNQNPSVSFALKRAYSQVKITLQKGNYTGAGQISNVTIKDAYPTGNINFSNGNLSGLGTADVNVLSSSTNLNDGMSWDMLMVPGVAASGKFYISFTIDGKPMDTLALPSVLLVAGTNYQITITVNNTGVSVNSVTLANWNTTSVSGGSIN
jgi:hypothetical protein